MRTKLTAVSASATLALVAVATTAVAHHGFAAYTTERVTVEAVMTEFRFVNPHVQLYFDITNEAGEIEHWQAELTAPNKLARGGWTQRTLQPDDRIRISGQLARNGGHSIRIRELVTANGESLPLGEILE